jgi:poly(A) polymerase
VRLLSLLAELQRAGTEALLLGPAGWAALAGAPVPLLAQPISVGVRAMAELPESLELQAGSFALQVVPLATAPSAPLACSDDLPVWLGRQPFTAWAVACDPAGNPVDPLGVMADLKAEALRPTASHRPSPDGVLAVAIAAARTGLTPSRELRRGGRDGHGVLDLPRDRVREGLDALLLAWRPAAGLTYLDEMRALRFLLPEVALLVGFHLGCPVHHKDIWSHTLRVVERSPPRLAVRWAALLHDVGKIWTRSVNRAGRVTFLRHEDLGALLAAGIAARLGMEPELDERIAAIIRNHARVNTYAAEWTDGAVRRLLRDLGPALGDILDLSQADCTTARAARIAEVRRLAADLDARVGRIQAELARPKALPKGLGLLLMTETGRTAGPWLGRIQRWLEAEVDAGRLEASRSPEECLTYLRDSNPDLLSTP